MTIFSESQDHDRQRPAPEAVSRHGHQLHRNRERVGKHVAPCARSALPSLLSTSKHSHYTSFRPAVGRPGPAAALHSAGLVTKGEAGHQTEEWYV